MQPRLFRRRRPKDDAPQLAKPASPPRPFRTPAISPGYPLVKSERAAIDRVLGRDDDA